MQTLLIELLHSFGLCLLVFHILPRMDMVRCMLHLSGIFVIPALLKTLFVIADKSLPGIKRLTLTIAHGIAFLIQFGNLAATSMFSIPLTDSEKGYLKNSVIDDASIINVIERPFPVFAKRIVWEIPVSLLFISLSYWENYVDGDVYICSLKIPLLQWKKNLLVVKQRLYILIGFWKIGWTMIFAILLIPGFDFNIAFSSLESNSTMRNVSNRNTFKVFETNSEVLPLMGKNKELSTTHHRNFTSTPLQGVTEKQIIKSWGGNSNVFNDAQINLTRTIKDLGIQSVLHLDDKSLNSKEDIIWVDKDEEEKSNNTLQSKSTTSDYIPELIKLNLQKYGVLYLHLISSTLMSYFGSLACKLCMQIFGFALPMFLATPITLGLIIGECYGQYLPSYLYVWVCPESSGDIRLYHLLWIGGLWISQSITTAHIWFPRNGRMAKIERYERLIHTLENVIFQFPLSKFILSFKRKMFSIYLK